MTPEDAESANEQGTRTVPPATKNQLAFSRRTDATCGEPHQRCGLDDAGQERPSCRGRKPDTEHILEPDKHIQDTMVT